MIDADAIINPPPTDDKTFALATVTGVSSGGLTIRFDGDTAAGQKKYKRLASYSSPASGDRVMVAYIGGSYLVLGKVI